MEAAAVDLDLSFLRLLPMGVTEKVEAVRVPVDMAYGPLTEVALADRR